MLHIFQIIDISQSDVWQGDIKGSKCWRFKACSIKLKLHVFDTVTGSIWHRLHGHFVVTGAATRCLIRIWHLLILRSLITPASCFGWFPIMLLTYFSSWSGPWHLHLLHVVLLVVFAIHEFLVLYVGYGAFWTSSWVTCVYTLIIQVVTCNLLCPQTFLILYPWSYIFLCTIYSSHSSSVVKI